MLLKDAPPDTSAYMIAGYAIFFAISVLYVVSLTIRRRNLEKDLETLEAIKAETGRRSGQGPKKPRSKKSKLTK
jgi:hypothetical protein